jgi:hypothetical protein
MKCVCWCKEKTNQIKYGLFTLEPMGDALTQQEKSLRQMVFLPFSVLRNSFTLA